MSQNNHHIWNLQIFKESKEDFAGSQQRCRAPLCSFFYFSQSHPLNNWCCQWEIMMMSFIWYKPKYGCSHMIDQLKFGCSHMIDQPSFGFCHQPMQRWSQEMWNLRRDWLFQTIHQGTYDYNYNIIILTSSSSFFCSSSTSNSSSTSPRAVCLVPFQSPPPPTPPLPSLLPGWLPVSYYHL